MKLLTKASFILLAALLPAAAWAFDFRSVAVPKAVLYDAPSAQGKKLFVVSQYYPLEVIVNLGEWIKVRDAGGSLAWIEARQVTGKRTVLVRVEEAEAHEAADAAARPVFRASKDVALELLETAPAGWAKVRHRDGLTGFILSTEVWGL